MRRRRFARCLLRADLALDDGCLDEARAALDEARDLQPDSPELVILEERLSECKTPPLAALAENPELLDYPPVLPPRPARRWISTAAVGLFLAAIVSAAFGIRMMRPVDTSEVSTAAAIAIEPLMALPVPDTPRPPEIRVEHETVTAPEAMPRILSDEAPPPRPTPPIAGAEPAARSEAVVATRTETSRTMADPPVSMQPQREARPSPVAPSTSDTTSGAVLPAPATGSLPPPSAPATPPITTMARAPTPDAPVTSAESRPVTPEPRAPRAASATPGADESYGIRAVLSEYETAYSRLDAAAASAVWPGVNRGALARAFRGLASQHVSLGSCDVTVEGAAARASCSGTATWEPRVGGGVRSEARRWDFELRKTGNDWQIERAATARGDGTM